MKTTAIIRLEFPSKKHLLVANSALLPETNRPATKRARAVLEQDGNFLVLKVEAENTVALRATLNAYLRWIGSMTSVIEVLEQSQ